MGKLSFVFVLPMQATVRNFGSDCLLYLKLKFSHPIINIWGSRARYFHFAFAHFTSENLNPRIQVKDKEIALFGDTLLFRTQVLSFIPRQLLACDSTHEREAWHFQTKYLERSIISSGKIEFNFSKPVVEPVVELKQLVKQ